MPASTPIYGFTYPCPGETITSGAFATLANQIDAKLTDVNNDLRLALNRPNVDLGVGSIGATQTITAGVDTVLTLPDSTYTILAAGVWMVKAVVDAIVSPATVNMMVGRIRQNGVVRYNFTSDTEGNTVKKVLPLGPLIAAAGDVITLQFLYNGAGTMDVYAELTARMLVRIP